MALRPCQLRYLSFFILLLASSVQAAPIAPGSGAAMCGALTVSDFQGVGVAKAAPPTANVTDKGASAYCVYAGKSSATGGIELDVFYPAGTNPGEAKATLETAGGELSSSLKPIAVPGADEARWSPNAVSGGPAFATILVLRGNLVFVLGIPANPAAQAQLLKLADLALKRF
ncbi:MAG TPA: hypothetical protein VJR29_06700 [bacterium]|nr:hypothetical protein [bacterium]